VRIGAFRWTRKNIQHIHRHRVKPREVEEAFLQGLDFRGVGQGRFILIGQSEAGRWLCVVFEILGGDIAYVITAREMTQREKHRFRRRMKGIQ